MHSIRSARSAAAAGVLVTALLLPVADRPARAADRTVREETWTGEIVSARSRWARGKTAIVTESVLRTPSGHEVTLRQLGGSVDGIGMVVLHSQPVLRVGDRVTARVAVAADLRGRTVRPVRALYRVGNGAGGALPFVRTEATDTRAPLAWDSGCALISFHDSGTSHIEGDLEFAEMERVLDRWNDEIQSCSFFELRYEGLTSGEVGLDGVNLVVLREDEWCRPATEDDPGECYDANAAGLTTLFFVDDPDSDRNGTLLDADVELNAVNFSLSVDDESAGKSLCKADLANTFTHEIGHLMGLDHTCWTGVGVQLRDDQGEPLRLCTEPALPEPVREATMYALQDCGETKKGSPEPDDVDGICAIYPLEDDPNECRPAELDPDSSCALAAPRGAAGWATLIAFALLLARRRRRG